MFSNSQFDDSLRHIVRQLLKTGSRISLALVRDDATVSDRCDAARLALGQLRQLAFMHSLRVLSASALVIPLVFSLHIAILLFGFSATAGFAFRQLLT